MLEVAACKRLRTVVQIVDVLQGGCSAEFQRFCQIVQVAGVLHLLLQVASQRLGQNVVLRDGFHCYPYGLIFPSLVVLPARATIRERLIEWNEFDPSASVPSHLESGFGLEP